MKPKSTSTIGVTIRFFGGNGIKDPKMFWSGGYPQMEANPSRGIKAGKAEWFGTLDALILTLDKLLKKRGITLLHDIDKNGNLIPRLGANY